MDSSQEPKMLNILFDEDGEPTRIRPFPLAFALVALLLVLLATQARGVAATEFCPAEVQHISPIGVEMGTPAVAYAYEIRAFTSRSVNGAIIADTDKGWYTWNVANVQLNLTKRTQGSSVDNAFFLLAVSPTLAVRFPEPLTIHHAWILTASTQGEGKLGWDKRGTVPCEVPPFVTASITQLPNPAPIVTPSPLPSPTTQAAIAVTAQPPFADAKCDVPFKVAKYKDIVIPGVREIPETANGPIISAIALVAVDGNGQLLDTWLLSSSGYAPADLAALRAARMSTYSGSISYCRHVAGVYAFVATFGATEP
jgi:hypothetical protein